PIAPGKTSKGDPTASRPAKSFPCPGGAVGGLEGFVGDPLRTARGIRIRIEEKTCRDRCRRQGGAVRPEEVSNRRTRDYRRTALCESESHRPDLQGGNGAE